MFTVRCRGEGAEGSVRADVLGADVVVVDDDPMILDCVCEAVLDLGFRVRQASDGKQAQDLLLGEATSLLITDYWMPKLDGLALVRWCREAGMRMPAILMSADPQARAAARLHSNGVPLSFLAKPFDFEALREAMIAARQPSEPPR